ncbi:MAG: hypothetical protein PVJ04_14880 [Gemmatimonadota bacterium]
MTKAPCRIDGRVGSKSELLYYAHMRIGSSVPGLLLVSELEVWKYDD